MPKNRTNNMFIHVDILMTTIKYYDQKKIRENLILLNLYIYLYIVISWARTKKNITKNYSICAQVNIQYFSDRHNDVQLWLLQRAVPLTKTI